MLCFAFLLFSLGLSGAHYSIDTSRGLGRVFDGIGAISGGGATSKLLVSYPEKERDEILDYLFKPNFGASLHILKVEIGGDAQSTDGTESSHMHESWDENYERGYEWWMMTEAKKRNPEIQLIGLPWTFPAWVGRGSGDPYKHPDDTALYVVKWILGAKRVHGLDIDYIGIWNERYYDIRYIKTLKATLLSHGLSKVKIIVADSDWWISKDILKDSSLASAVDVIGAHYPGTTSTPEAVQTKKALWSSEDYSTFNNDDGAGCQARILNQNYVKGMMTSTIAWNLVSSYYQDLPFGEDGLMTAEQPWGGHYVVSNPIWVTAHTTQFTSIGWTYLNHGSGVGMLDRGGSYVTLVSPDGRDMTIIIETMTHKNSQCIRPWAPEFNVTSQQAEFFLQGSLANIEKFHVWKTDFKAKQIFERIAPIRPSLGSFRLNLEPGQLYTLTTLNSGSKGFYGLPPSPKEFPRPYFDNFQGYKEFSEAELFVPQSGVWEVMPESTNSPNKVNRQVILNKPINWCSTGETTVNVGGNHKWTDVETSVHVKIPSINGTSGAFVGARISNGGCEARDTKGIFFTIYPGNSTFAIHCKITRDCFLGSGPVSPPLKFDTWHKLGMTIKGSEVKVSLDGKFIARAAVPSNVKNGFVGYGTTTYSLADFDNFYVN